MSSPERDKLLAETTERLAAWLAFADGKGPYDGLPDTWKDYYCRNADGAVTECGLTLLSSLTAAESARDAALAEVARMRECVADVDAIAQREMLGQTPDGLSTTLAQITMQIHHRCRWVLGPVKP